LWFVITSFAVDRSQNGWVEERSSIKDRGAASRIAERLATLYSVAASKNRLDRTNIECVTTRASGKMALQALLYVAWAPTSLQRVAL
jgi:pyruvoyl-dependent arginine decarboxylase (PvlArgDC)